MVLCTNGFIDHVIENDGGDAIATPLQHRVSGNVGYMAAILEPAAPAPPPISYLASPRIGFGQAYYYLTRRPFESGAGAVTLTCIGGRTSGSTTAATTAPTPPTPRRCSSASTSSSARCSRPIAASALPYVYTWHGLMAYTPSQVRQIGPEPRNPALLYGSVARREPVLAQAVAERLARDPERPGGGRHVVARALERLLDHRSLDGVEGHACVRASGGAPESPASGAGRAPSPSALRELEPLGGEEIVFREQHAALHHVPELPHVARASGAGAARARPRRGRPARACSP